MRPHVEELARIAPIYVSAYPNAGLPNPLLPTGFPETPEDMAPALREWAENGWLNIVGGCCGTTPDHIRAIAEAVPRPARRAGAAAVEPYTRLSGLDALTIRPDTNFVNVGERTNVTGSPKFAKLIKDGDYEDAVAVARQQVASGGADRRREHGRGHARLRAGHGPLPEPDRGRAGHRPRADHDRQLEVERDRGRPAAASRARASSNSISLKEGEDAVPPPGAAGAALRRGGGGDGLRRAGPGRHRRAQGRDLPRAYRILTEEVGFPPEDIIFDPNVLTVATGMEEHNDYAVAFIEATRRDQGELPGCKVSGGISNISFSFRGNNLVREAMHSAFLYHAIRAGLDMGIVNAGQLEVYEEIPKDLLELVEDVLLNRRPDATERLITSRSR